MAAQAQRDAPLEVRNLTPVSLLYGIPYALGSHVQGPGIGYSLNLEHASVFTAKRTNRSSVFFDGETTVANYSWRRGWRSNAAAGTQNNWEVGVSVPLVGHSGGFLDGTIDGFHRVFDLPDGGRPGAPRNQIDYLVQLDNVIYANFQESQWRLGDIRGWIGYQWLNTPKRSLALRAQLKAPIGSVERLTGSEATDVALWLEYGDRALLEPLSLGWNFMAGGAYLGRGELAPKDQKKVAGFAQLGVYFQLLPRLQIHGQLAAQTRIIRSEADQVLGSALQGTLGARVLVNNKFNVDFAIVEDLHSRSSADVVFNLRLGLQLQ